MAPTRYFTRSEWVIKRDNRDHDTVILVDGIQHHDGTVHRTGSLNDDDITPEQARRTADALLAAADEAETMAPTTR